MAKPDELEEWDAIEISGRLRDFFWHYEPSKDMVVEPEFLGCGIIEGCRGDVFAGATLFEIKAGERDFRLVDVRQLITYCALALEVGPREIEAVGVVNPRMGVFFEAKLDELCESMAGLSAVDVLGEVRSFISSDRPSR